MAREEAHLRRLTVEPCPRCGDRHDYSVELRHAPLIFGGGERAITTTARCMSTGNVFETRVEVRADEEFVRIVDAASLPNGDPLHVGDIDPATCNAPSASETTEADDEFDDWIKESRDPGLDFGKTMLTASSGAIAVYFAVLNYLGTAKAGRSVTGLLSVASPVVFLAATGVFAIALRPHLAPVSRQDFSSFRAAALRRISRYNAIGLALFLVALVLALVVYSRVLGL